jgi:circadian clock protein KaiB
VVTTDAIADAGRRCGGKEPERSARVEAERGDQSTTSMAAVHDQPPGSDGDAEPASDPASSNGVAHFRLYVAGSGTMGGGAARRTERALAQCFRSAFVLEVVDIFEQPELAFVERIVATPTLVKVSPPPRVRVVGRISDSEILGEFLGPRTGSLPVWRGRPKQRSG